MNPITNRFHEIRHRPALPIERQTIQFPSTAWAYAHHPFLVVFHGRFFAMWSSGRRNEDDVGQRVMLSSSADGRAWDEPRPLQDTRLGEHVELTLTAAGFHVHGDVLVAYLNRMEYDPACLVDGHRPVGYKSPSDHRGSTLLAMTSRDGRTWSEALDLGLAMDPNHGPQATRSGRLIISGHTMHPWSDDPGGLKGWHRSGIYPQGMAERIVDDSANLRFIADEAGWGTHLCEGSFIETDAGVLRMFQRSGEPRLWVSESHDDGVTWSTPEPTDFTNNTNKFHLGRLPDGRFYHLGTPDPKPVMDRFPLMLSLSPDGACFDQQYIVTDQVYTQHEAGMHKHGQYGYVHSLIHKDTLHLIISRCKEAIEIIHIPLSAL